VAVVLVVLLFGVVLDVAAVSSGKNSKTGQTDATQVPESSFTDYVPRGYSIEGPLTIVSATTKAINFFSGSTRKPLVLDLQGTQFSVKDVNNTSLSFSALTAGVRVYVCRSADKKTIIIFVVPSSIGGRNDV
jgi:hypothetical protein